MRLDSQLMFVPPGAPLSLVAGAGVSIPSSATLDLLGAGVGVAPTNIIGVSALTFGADVGIGGDKAQVEVVIGTAPTTSNSCTLNIAFQAAPDTGSSGGYQPGTWTTLVETGPIAVASLTAGQVLARFDFPPAFPAGQRPRFLRLLFQVPAGENFATGTISFAVVTFVRDDQGNKYAQRNFSVA